jgi:hypothetical protein
VGAGRFQNKEKHNMKNLKALSVAVMATVALMAFVGAGTASATVLCKTPGTGTPTGTTCPAGWAYPGGTEIHSVNWGAPTLHTVFKTINYTTLTTKYETANEGGASETVNAREGTLILSGGNCTATVLSAGTQEIHWISGSHNGTVTSSGTKVTMVCGTIFGNVHCTYVTNNTDFGILEGGSEPTVNVVATLPVDEANSDGLCAEESKWTVVEKLTANTQPLYVAAHT